MHLSLLYLKTPAGTNLPSARTLKSLVPAATKTTVSLRMVDRWMSHPHFHPHHQHLKVHHLNVHPHILVFQELRLSGPNNRKTKRCNKYWSATGFCLYGIRCDYIHSEKEEQRKEKNEPKVKTSKIICIFYLKSHLRSTISGELYLWSLSSFCFEPHYNSPPAADEFGAKEQ